MEFIILGIIKIIDNMISTAKNITTYKGKKLLTSLLVIISQFLFYFLIDSVVSDDSYTTIIVICICSGVGFILSDDTVVKQGDIVNVSWYDGHYSTTRKEIVDVLYKVDAHVVRVIPMNNNRRLIGCVLDEPSNTISKYVMLKQRERLQAQRNQLRKSLDKL